MKAIRASVGFEGENQRQDVKLVQRLLNQHDLPPLRKLREDGIAGPHTVDVIKHFQSVIVKMRQPDGRVDPGGRTFRKLRQRSSPAPKSLSTQLSGKNWWHKNQRKYPTSRRLEALEPGFRKKATAFVAALNANKAKVKISCTFRHAKRAYLMHYAWDLAHGKILAADIPAKAGVDIQWVHGSEKASRKAAREMVRLFNMAYPAALNTTHRLRKAIDITISWQNDLRLAQFPDAPEGKQGKVIWVRSAPRNGARNRDLHRAVEELYGIKKLLKDRPHWSYNGR